MNKGSLKKSALDFLINPNYIAWRQIEKKIESKSNLLNNKILDFGCGHMPYKNYFNYSEYIGIDLKNYGDGNIADIHYDGRELPIEDNCFDSIFASASINLVEDIDLTIAEFKRVLKNNGMVLLWFPVNWFYNPPFSPELLSKKLIQLNFKKVKVDTCICNFSFVFLVFLKLLNEVINYLPSYILRNFVKVLIFPFFNMLGILFERVKFDSDICGFYFISAQNKKN